MASQSGEQQGVDLMTLPPQQLAQIKEQLEGQIEQFSVNFQDLQVGGSLEISLFPDRKREPPWSANVSIVSSPASLPDGDPRVSQFGPCYRGLEQAEGRCVAAADPRLLRPADQSPWALALSPSLRFVAAPLTRAGLCPQTHRKTGKEVLVPLTSSLYVSGTLGDSDKVMVDIGTGYYVEKKAEGGIDYCKRKVKLLSESLASLAEIIQQKRRQVQQVQQVFEIKMKQFQAQEQAQVAADT